MTWSPNPVQTLILALAWLAYLRAVRVLRRRGVEVPLGQQAAWHGGMVLWAIALLTPVDSLGDELLSAHMAQHLLLAELGAPLLLFGVRTPVLQHLLPPPLLVPLARAKRLRRIGRLARLPLVAIPIYALVLYGWHLRPAFEGAVESEVLHALQHQSFIVISVLVWWPAIEPDRQRLRGELWKIGHVLSARIWGMFLGMGFIIMRSPAYPDVYGTGGYGLSPLEDQQLAGGMMLVLDTAIMLFALAFFFWRSAADHDLMERREREAAGRGPASHNT